MPTYIIHDESMTIPTELDGGKFVVYEIGANNRFQSVAHFLQEKIAGQPESKEIQLDAFEEGDDGWYNGAYTRFKILSGSERELVPVDVATKFKLK